MGEGKEYDRQEKQTETNLDISDFIMVTRTSGVKRVEMRSEHISETESTQAGPWQNDI